MTQNKKQKKAARALSAQLGVSYQNALQRTRGDLGGPGERGAREYTAPGQVYLRPFDTVLSDEPAEPLRIAGRIEDDGLVVEVLGQTVRLKAIEVGQDDRGPFVAVREQVQPLLDGFELRVDIEPDPDMPPNGVIDVVREGPLRALLKDEMAAQGVNGILMHPNERHYSIYFGGDGTPEARFRKSLTSAS